MVSRVPWSHLTLQVIINAINYPPEHYGKALLLKIPYTWTKNMREFLWYSTKNFKLYWLSFLLLEEAIIATRGENNHQFHPAVKHANYSNGVSDKTFTFVAQCWQKFYGNNYILIVYKACSTKWKSYLKLLVRPTTWG